MCIALPVDSSTSTVDRTQVSQSCTIELGGSFQKETHK
jgi:hypothetical protein